ncbi:DedA family protein [Krasilnikoviella flava]|uniref:Membrane protein DedA, SNARE-associated domain n=1 Tax=Krasilnikoviella flava TaxID=526729 RepID=A0A1T5JKP7_9MICO|nr:VTT domain-containing protein [Krasilnikoviella flava]SKC51954.1 membrane protein DedA, SNARE-associated domain [Krasilnikoviella flava]
MIDAIASLWAQLESMLFGLVASAWAFPALFASTAADGFFPPVPGETVIIMLAVGAETGSGVNLALVVLVAALGAWCGDQVAYALGRALGTSRVPFLRGPRGQRAVAWAARSFERRGASVVLGARFVPVGRMAVNVTAGAVGFPRRRFMGLSAVASVAWAGWSVLIGVVAAQPLGDHPLLAVAVGVVVGTVLGVVVDRVLTAWGARGRRAAAPAPRTPAVARREPALAGGGVGPRVPARGTGALSAPCGPSRPR